MNRFELSGKAAIVTGAGSGLGRHFALTLARAGASVAVLGRDVTKLDRVVKEIEAFDGRAIAARVDVLDRASILQAIATAETELGAIGILVNNAGISVHKPLLDQTEDDWDKVVDTNLKGAWLVAQETARHMVRLGHGGSIVNIASVLGLRATGAVPGYVASKAGLVHLTRAMALELARHGIRVNAVLPGWIATDMTAAGQASQVMTDKVISRVPIRRWGRPEEFGGIAVYLASDAASYQTGTTVVVDGGYSVF